MDRRAILRYTALATGAAIGAPLFSTFLSGCKTEPATSVAKATETLHFFDAKEFSLVKDLVDLILPKTDSPAATEVGVHTMIDHMVGNVYKQENQEKYKKGFTALAAHLQEAGFGKLDKDKKLAFLKELGSSKADNLKDASKAFLDLKQQTVAYYLSSEEIGTKFLNYLPVPGAYKPCISLKEMGGKAWAL